MMEGAEMKSYTFEVVIEKDEDVWAAYCPALVEKGASTWGYTNQKSLPIHWPILLDAALSQGQGIVKT